MKRPFSVIVIAILMSIEAALLAVGSLAFLALGRLAVTAGVEGPMPQLFSEMGTIGAGILLFLAVAYALLAIYVLRLVYWARLAATVLISTGLLLAAIGILTSMPHPKVLVFAWQIFVIAVDVCILWYLTRPRVKEAFAAPQRHPDVRALDQTQRDQKEVSRTVIRELTREASLDLLARTHLARLACTREGQPYIVPIYFAYNDNCIYSFSTVGQKIEWMRSNPMVCVQMDEVTNSQHWVSIIVSGRFEELPDVDEWRGARAFAYELLRRNAMWWEPGYAKTILHGAPRPLEPVFYRIHIAKITGHRASSDPGSV
jgi:nitroimidazol reductase NimA-like FMN-containing flavoprotein (pyridoxamine 5'-phosphate oxidase superfamily)